MRVLLTGGTGPVGGEVARLLLERGDAVRAVVAAPAEADRLRALGCELVVGDLSDEAALVTACHGVQAVVHAAALEEVGVGEAGRADLVELNVCGTEHVLGAALAAGVQRAVYVSAVVVFGDTSGRVADETWLRDPATPWSSVYEETRAVAHGRALELGARGLPLVIVQPGAVYGPRQVGPLGRMVELLLAGRLPALVFPELGLSPVHHDDVAAGVVLALDKGVPGESYVLAGVPVRAREIVALLSAVSGRAAPRLTVPSGLLKVLAPLGRLVAPALGLPPDLRELVSSADGRTFWASAAKAERELGWSGRPLRDGLADLVGVARDRPGTDLGVD